MNATLDLMLSSPWSRRRRAARPAFATLAAFTTFAVLGASALLGCGAQPAPVAAPSLPAGDGPLKPDAPAPAADPDAWRPRGELLLPPEVSALPPLKLPTIARFTLANGLPVLVIPSARAPVVSMQLVVRAGKRNEPKARLGLAELTSNLLVKGTARRNAAALVKAIEAVAGTIAVDVSYEAAFASCSALARNLGTCASLLSEIVTVPTFPAKELEDMRAALVAGVRSRSKNPRQWANLHLQHLLWGDNHVRGWAETEGSLASITRDDVVTWHKTWFTPGNAMLVVAGDVELAQLRPQLERAFGLWRKSVTAPAPKYPAPALPPVRVRLVDQPGAALTQLRVGLRGISHDDPRFFESLVWNHALGASGAARLPRALRAAGAAVTAAESTFDRNADQGSIVISAAARSSEALAAVQLLLAETSKVAKEGLTVAEVAAAITAISGSYLTRFESAADLTSSLVGAELHGFGEQYLQNFGVRLAQVTPASAKEAAEQLLDLNRSVVVLVGDAKDLEPQLTKLGWRFEKVKITDALSPATEAPATDVPPAQVAAARKTIEAAIKAKGGEARLRAIKALHLAGGGQTVIDNTPMQVQIRRWFVLPDRLRVDVEIDPPGDDPPATIQIGVDGDTGWQRSPEGLQDIPADALSSVEFERWREPELVLLEARAASVPLAPLPEVSIDGKPHTVVRVSSPFGIDLILAFDKQTMLLRRMTYTIADETNVDEFSSYRDIGGIKVAHKRVSTAGGRTTTVELSKVEISPKIDLSIFKRP